MNGEQDGNAKDEGGAFSQLPKYIPPLPNPDIVREVVNSQRGGGSKVQHRLLHIFVIAFEKNGYRIVRI